MDDVKGSSSTVAITTDGGCSVGYNGAQVLCFNMRSYFCRRMRPGEMTVGAVLPGNRRSPNNYYALCRHIIVVPQNPGPLLQIEYCLVPN